MTEWVINVFQELGAPIGALIILTYLIIQERKSADERMKSHREERDEWKQSYVGLQDKTDNVIDLLRESNERIQDRTIMAINEFKQSNQDTQSRQIIAIEELTTAIQKQNARAEEPKTMPNIDLTPAPVPAKENSYK